MTACPFSKGDQLRHIWSGKVIEVDEVKDMYFTYRIEQPTTGPGSTYTHSLCLHAASDMWKPAAEDYEPMLSGTGL